MSQLVPDIRFALRIWRRRPGLATAIVVSLALGIGANTAIVSVADAVLFRPLPVEQPERLVRIVLTRSDRGGRFGVAFHNFLAWRDRSRSFQGIAASRPRGFALRLDDGTSRVFGTEVSPGFFDVLGVRPELGTGFVVGDDGAPDGVVLSHSLWSSHFGGDPRVVGRGIVLDGVERVVVGVLPKASEQSMLEWHSLFVPLAIDEAAAWQRQEYGFGVLGRFRDGVALDDAGADLRAIAATLEQEVPAWNEGWTVELHPVRWWLVTEVERPLHVLLVAVALVLLIACANASHVLLAHGASRRRELQIRGALGAGRARLLRQALTETALLGIPGAVLGLLLAAAVLRFLVALAPRQIPRLDEAGLDARTFLACLAISALAVLVAGVLPAWRSSGAARAAGSGTRAGGAWRAATSRRPGSWLIATQVAVAIVLVFGAGLFATSLSALRRVDPGFDPDHLLTLRLELDRGAFPETADRLAAFGALLARAANVPGVESAAMSGVELPLVSGQGVYEVWIEGQPRTEAPQIVLNAQAVSPSYFETMGIAVVAGERFPPADTWDATQRVVVNEAFARRFFPGSSNAALGRWLEWRNGQRGHIVGVVRDVHQLGLDAEPAAEVYLAWGGVNSRQILVVRTRIEPRSVAGSLRGVIEELAPGTPVWDVATGEELIGGSIADRAFAARIIASFGGLALALAAIGAWGVVSFTAGARRHEIAVRLAIGGARRRIVALIARETMVPVILGVAAGTALAFAAGRTVASELYGISASDPGLLAGTALCILFVAAVACWVPARRAAGNAPWRTLREE